eukprot:472896-Rhodomonas_salina.1
MGRGAGAAAPLPSASKSEREPFALDEPLLSRSLSLSGFQSEGVSSGFVSSSPGSPSAHGLSACRLSAKPHCKTVKSQCKTVAQL